MLLLAVSSFCSAPAMDWTGATAFRRRCIHRSVTCVRREHRIVGISGYAVRPPQLCKEKPRVSAFISADIPKILAREPDLVLTFSDLQAEVVAALIRCKPGLRVWPAFILGKPGSPSQLPTCNLFTVTGALHIVCKLWR